MADLGRLAHPAHFQLGYNLAAHRTHLLLAGEAHDAARRMLPDLRDDARDGARRVMLDAGEAIEAGVDGEMARFLLETVEPSAALVLAGLLVIAPEDAVATAAPRDAPAAKPAGDSLSALRAGLRTDGHPSVGDLVRFAHHRERALSPRSHYTAACFYATLAGRHPSTEKLHHESLDQALRELTIALVGAAGREAREWAERVHTDPSLGPLVADPSRREALEDLLGAFAEPPAPPPRDSFDED